jgi:peroxiredoxin-like protein
MNDLSFEIQLRWSGTGREGAGEIQTHDLALELSAPESMGGRGVGTNPEELLVCAVSSCYTATLFGVLRRAKLPVDSVTVDARGTVTGSPGRVRFAGIIVSPTILGGDIVRQTVSTGWPSGHARSSAFRRWCSSSTAKAGHGARESLNAVTPGDDGTTGLLFGGRVSRGTCRSAACHRRTRRSPHARTLAKA